MDMTLEPSIALPSAELRPFLEEEFAGDLTNGALPPTLATALINAECLAEPGAESTSPSRAAVAEIVSLSRRFGEDCPLEELIADPPAYRLGSRVLPRGYVRTVVVVALQDLLDSGWAACSAAGGRDFTQLQDLRARVVSQDGGLRIEISGEEGIPDGDALGLWVSSDEVPTNPGCDPPGAGRYCGYTAGGSTRYCNRCYAIHRAEQELLEMQLGTMG